MSIFSSMAQQFQDVSFGMSNSSEVLTHYNITRSSICLFRMVSWVAAPAFSWVSLEFCVFNTVAGVKLRVVADKDSDSGHSRRQVLG